MKIFSLLLAVFTFTHCEITVDTNRNFLPVSVPKVRCPEGFKSINGQCYYFSFDSSDWFYAVEACNDLDAMLLSLDDFMEEGFLNIFIRMHPELKDIAFWTSGTDQRKEGYWMWYSTMQPIHSDFTDWCQGEPDNGNATMKKNFEDCLIYRLNGERCWHDAQCRSETIGKQDIHYICEAAHSFY